MGAFCGNHSERGRRFCSFGEQTAPPRGKLGDPVTDEQYELWPYKDMNGFCLDIGDTVRTQHSKDPLKIVIFTIGGTQAVVTNGWRQYEIPLGKLLWLR